ncbi:MAG: hypothetical protein HKO90_05405, partial [Flavobacteriaceae bacterium]|nr:hypothetical protein [Flavobacteriaceae bacterium]
VINDLIEKKFAFDIELLLKSELYQKGSVVKIPIAWIDSEAASTTTDLQPYLPMLKSIVRMNQKYFPDDNDHNAFAGFIESLDEETFQKILNEIPKEIVSRNPDEFTRYDGVQVTDFKKD